MLNLSPDTFSPRLPFSQNDCEPPQKTTYLVEGTGNKKASKISAGGESSNLRVYSSNSKIQSSPNSLQFHPTIFCLNIEFHSLKYSLHFDLLRNTENAGRLVKHIHIKSDKAPIIMR